MFLKTGNNNNKANNNLSLQKVILFLIGGGEVESPYQITSFMLILLPKMTI